MIGYQRSLNLPLLASEEIALVVIETSVVLGDLTLVQVLDARFVASTVGIPVRLFSAAVPAVSRATVIERAVTFTVEGVLIGVFSIHKFDGVSVLR